MRLRDLKIGVRLMGGFLLASAVAAVVGAVGLSGLGSVSAAIGTLYSRDMVAALDAREAVRLQNVIGRDLRKVLLQRDANKRPALADKVEEEIAAFSREVAGLEAAALLPENKARVAQMKELLPGYLEAQRTASRRAAAGDRDGAEAELERIQETSTQLEGLISGYAQFKKELAAKAYQDSEALSARLRTQLWALIAAGALASLVAGWILARQISQPLAASVAALERVAAGDLSLTIEADSQDEVGRLTQALGRAIARMRDALAQVSAVSAQVAGAAQQLSSASSSIASGAQEQASGLEETSASLEEITSTVKQNAESAVEADRLASEARRMAEQGGEIVRGAVGAMDGITDASRKIADITGAIDEIAFQTNLLALNAAVEAARAGEQGRGFGVVASEVRALSQRCGAAAKEIKSLIATAAGQVQAGAERVAASGKSLGDIVASSSRVTSVVGEIARASREQSAGIDQVTTAVAEMDKVTQSNAAQTEELSATAEQLSAHAAELQDLLGRFVLSGRAASPLVQRRAAVVQNEAAIH